MQLSELPFRNYEKGGRVVGNAGSIPAPERLHDPQIGFVQPPENLPVVIEAFRQRKNPNSHGVEVDPDVECFLQFVRSIVVLLR